jgi:hypothetical protein
MARVARIDQLQKARRANSEPDFPATKLFSWIFAFKARTARVGGRLRISLRRFANRDLRRARVARHENAPRECRAARFADRSSAFRRRVCS